jgi:HEAT repeat protein
VGIGSRIKQATGVRDEELATIAHVTAVFAALETGRGLGEVGVNTLVVSRLPPGTLPWLFIPLGITSLIVAVGYGGALARVQRARLFGITLLAVAGVLAAEWLMLAGGIDVVPIVWITVMAAGSIAVTIGWTVAGTSLDARQAKRLFPLCTAAAIAGYLVGSLLAGPITAITGNAASLIALQAALFGAAAVVIGRLARRSMRPGWAPPPDGRRPIVEGLRIGFDEVRRSPLMRLVAVAYVLFAVLLFSVTFPYLTAAEAAFSTETEVASALGLVSAIVTAVSLVIALVVANRFYARFGVATAALVLPVVYLAGFAIWIVQFSFATAAAVIVAQQVTQRGLSNAAWSAFYNVVPSSRRAQVLAFNDGVPGQIGIILSGVLLLTAGSLLAPEQVFWMGLIAAAVCVAVVVTIRRRYAEALLRTLRSGVGEQILEGGPALGDLLEGPEVRAALIEALSADDGRTRQTAAALLSRSSSPDAQTALATAIDDPDPTVAASGIVAALGQAIGPSGATGDRSTPRREMDRAGDAQRGRAEHILAAMLTGDADARVSGLTAIDRLRRSLPGGAADPLLHDPDPRVRAAALEVLCHTEGDAAVSALLRGLADPESLVRRAAAVAIAERPDLPANVTELLDSESLDVREAAIAALEGHGPAVHDQVVAWADRQVARAVMLADARAVVSASTGGAGVTPSSGAGASSGAAGIEDFLSAILANRIERHERLALGAMSVLGAPAARGVIRRCLHADDPEVRAQAIEAIDSIGDRRLGGAIARLFEHVPDPKSPDLLTVCARLRDDDDPWIRHLAMRIRPIGDDMADESQATLRLDTMLRLRTVPLFEGLAPEDLQRFAMVATERWFEPGEVLVREGDVGDELYVILEGSVVVTRRQPDESERVLRTYGAGDHVGELAVLRARPRVATVTAEAERVRTLVVGGDGLVAILRERPEVAMALLATLAERLSVQ